MAQTTEKQAKFNDLVSYLQGKAPDVKILPTLCAATQLRQKAALELAGRVDTMIVVGGRHSSNTRKLWEICRDINPDTYLIEEAGELDPCWLTDKNTIGITAGASTPAWIIKEVIQKMENYIEQKEITCSDEQPNAMAVNDQPQAEETVPEKTKQNEEQNEEQNGERQEEEKVQQEENAQQEENIQQEEAGGGQGAADQPGPEEQAQVQSIQDLHDQLDFRSFKPGDIVKGNVVKVSADEVLVDIGGKSEGIITADQFSYRRVDPRDQVAPGQGILVEVIKEDKEGNLLLSIKGQAGGRFLQLEEAKEKGRVITHRSSGCKGGLLVDVGIRGFVPASRWNVPLWKT